MGHITAPSWILALRRNLCVEAPSLYYIRYSVLGDIAFEIDGEPLDFSQSVTYRGMMFTGVPNLLWIFGYFRASWTLRVDMLGDFVCKLLNHMDEIGAKRVDVALREEDKNMAILPWIESDNFNPGYLMRGIDQLPQRGDKPEWRHIQHYWAERKEIPAIHLDGEEFVYDGMRQVNAVQQRKADTA